MRFMILVKANQDSEAGIMPAATAHRNGPVQRRADESRHYAGRRRAAAQFRRGRASSSPASKRKVIDGPFTETKELVAGFWIWQVKSKEEAIEWVKRCPNPTGDGGCNRNSSTVRSRGFRRGIHPRTPRAGGAGPGGSGEAEGEETVANVPGGKPVA